MRQGADDASNYSVYGTTTPHMGAAAGGSGAGGRDEEQGLVEDGAGHGHGRGRTRSKGEEYEMDQLEGKRSS